METIYRLPFLRICLFLIAGILFGLLCPTIHFPWWLPFPFALPLLGCLLIPNRLQYKLRWLPGTVLFLLLFVAGATRTQETAPTFWETDEEETPYVIGEIEGAPQKKKSTYGASLLLFGQGIPKGTRVMAYIAQDSASEQLRDGDILIFPTRLTKKEGEPSEYDKHLRQKGYSGSFYIPEGRWRTVGHEERQSLRGKAGKARRWAEERYQANGLQGEELAIASALTLGDKSMLDKELRRSYSATGASHVLAVSGLHVGIIYLVIIALLQQLFRGNRFKPIRVILALTGLWSYAFVAGLSASVVRASVMFSLVSIGEMMRRKSPSLNIVFASAFLMLLYEPRYLNDVGFQLSYAAVFAILLLHERIYKSLKISNFILDKAWSLTSVSIAAQLGTMPIMLYHFHQFSNCFWLSGLIVIPAATLLIYGCSLLLMATSFPVISNVIGSLLSGLIKGMNSSIRWLEGLPHSNVSGIAFGGIDVLLLYALLGSLLAVVQEQSFRRISILLSILLTYSCHLLVIKVVGQI